ncbi:recombinase family protein [Nitrosomonas sp. JL21]|uniref:recombinase family protein n=1 Tax=Nitrosomonas sp. JL21 TaxID=153949 RepID=UPI001368A7B8|nr:recombinase family protein [Nitrosomonas sp. JL21]MBL8496794.1 recombinase family protein [Nitrosomonas sp.]MBL8498454.1 recombinase family protein [Nitrosomonas sp.]MXS78132.1 recombinase family protein [Nitrosomonas sp. JL21]
MYKERNHPPGNSGRIIGYARVSTEDQHLDLQINALKLAGCNAIFEDRGISATAKRRPGFEKALSHLQTGDVFVVWKMDRAFRSLKNALNILEEFENRAIEFRCLTEDIDTTTPMGKCMYQIRHAFSELERNLIRERTKAGMEAARQRGARLGRPKKLSRCQIIQMQGLLQREPEITPIMIADQFGVSLRTIYRELSQYAKVEERLPINAG